MGRQRRLRWAGYVLAWLVLAVPTSLGLFLNSQTTVTVASHDAIVQPTLDGYATLRTGPFLPDVRRETGSLVGVELQLGKTEAPSTQVLVERYAFIASQPEAQVVRVENAVRQLAIDAALRGAVVAVVPLLIWALAGARRREELFGRTRWHRIATAGVAVVLVSGILVVLAERPWDDGDETLVDTDRWIALQDYIPEIDVPEEAAGIEVQGSLTASGTKRLVFSAVDTYRRSREFYDKAVETAETLEVRPAGEGETVAVIVSDRHDNIGMDPVVRAVADRAGATAILDAGDDTSTGQPWEAFSLDSLDNAFEDFDKYAVQGNHDHGNFVQGYLRDLDWLTAAAEPREGPGDSVLMQWNDPRSSGLGTWRDEPGLSVDETAERIADVACSSEERVNTLLVHDSDMGTAALEAGCVDLVVSGHVHVQVGPDLVIGSNGERGYTYTNGTTGGAAYALAVGSKLRRPAEFTLLTYRGGRPRGLQVVTLQTNGVFRVSAYVELVY